MAHDLPSVGVGAAVGTSMARSCCGKSGAGQAPWVLRVFRRFIAKRHEIEVQPQRVPGVAIATVAPRMSRNDALDDSARCELQHPVANTSKCGLKRAGGR